MSDLTKTMFAVIIHANSDDDPWVNRIRLVNEGSGTTAQMKVAINAEADYVLAPVGTITDIYSGIDISESDALDLIDTALGGNMDSLTDPGWRWTMFTVSNATDSQYHCTGTKTFSTLDNTNLASSVKSTILTQLSAIRDASHNTVVLMLHWEDALDGLIPAGETTSSFFWVFRWNDTNDTLEISYDQGVTWYEIATGITTLQAALDALAAAYPTEAYDAAINSDGYIQVRPSNGTAGTITFSSEYQTLLEEGETWIAPMRYGVDFSKWV